MLTLSLIGLGSSLLVLYSLIKVFRLAFWGNAPGTEPPKVKLKGGTAVAAGFLVLVILMGLGAERVNTYVSQAGDVLGSPQLYIEAVLKE
ncbi:Na(+)/H(+) antiporter subunit D [compost metagenome]